MSRPIVFAIAFILGLSLLVGTLDYKIAKGLEIEKCTCKDEIKGKVLYASLCQAESIKGPVFKECLYK